MIRRTLSVAAVGLSVTLAAAGCTSSPSQQPTTAPSTVASAATTATPARPELPGADASLLAATKALYAAKPVAYTPAAAALGKRKAAPLPAGATAGMGTWRSTPIATVVAGSDVTLWVKKGQAWTVVGGWWPSLGVAKPTLNQKRFVLFMGSDARPGEDPERTRADSLHIAAFDGVDGAGMLGIARDSWVTLPRGRKGKINAALTEGGPEGMTATVARVSGIGISDWILTDFPGFEKMVDEVGGLEYVLPPHASKIGLPPGKTKLTGERALRWARERKILTAGDFDRSRNQGLLMMAGAVVARQKGAASLPRYLTAIDRHVRTNMDAERALTYFASIYRIDPAKAHQGVAAGGIGTSAGGASIVVPGPAETAAYTDLRDGNLAKNR